MLLLDVRPQPTSPVNGAMSRDARSLPLEELPVAPVGTQDHKQRSIRLICRTDQRSAQAARVLAEAGFTDAQVIRGGMTAWRANGWPVAGA